MPFDGLAALYFGMRREWLFALLAGLIFALGVAVPLVPVPVEFLRIGSIISSVLFVSLPIALIFVACGFRWSPLSAGISLLCSLVFFGVCYWLLRERIGEIALVGALNQLAVLGWASSLGILIATSLRDKNLIFPISLVLVTVDLIAVFAPSGTVKQALSSEKGKAIFDAVSFKIPQFGHAAPFAQIGPADFLFIAMFFALMYRFGMRTRETALAMIPTLVVYLLVALMVGPLPALVPVGLVVLIVNRKEFSMSRAEKGMTLGVGIVCVSVLIYMFRGLF